jgi:hypothetical protein
MRARRRSWLGVAAWLGTASCATAQVGNFTQHAVPVDRRLAADAVAELEALYPPGATRFALHQEVSDPFGTALLGGLRHAGYAILEAARDGAAQPTGFVPLAYVLDEAEQLCRLTLWIGNESLSRPYQPDGAPQGGWVRRRSA